MIDRLSDPQIQQALEKLNGWKQQDNRSAIHKTFKFKNFETAWSFMNTIAETAESMDHHPEWSNVYNRVEITLTTHDAGGITCKDIELAQKIEETLLSK